MQLRDLHRQYTAMKEEMNEALLRVMDSSFYIMGDSVAELEARLADYVGVRHCVSCASGTDALYLALRTLQVGQGDAVFVPDFTFFATAEAVALVGATPVFVDVDEFTYNISVADLKAKYDSVRQAAQFTPKAVIAVDLFGRTADYTMLEPWCHSEGLLLIEDGAQGFGAMLGGRHACSFGDIATTSFFPAKPLGCYGDGGALFTDNDDWASMLRSLRVHGKGADKYDNVRIGLNSRLDTLQAAALLVKLRHLSSEQQVVQQVASRYQEHLSSESVGLPVIPNDMVSAWAQYTVRVSQRDRVREALQEAGVPSAVYYPRTLSQQPAFAALRQQPCATAVRLTSEVLSLPIHPYLTDEEVDTVVRALQVAGDSNTDKKTIGS
ncbi:MAG: DegT/DnrJ/EryC1/StrS family aminotransferase [Bacteroidales bacterium]|nr:DegT/DnrJ/EryC1/StrS family aminotransferase [Bacteroidales bacterium]